MFVIGVAGQAQNGKDTLADRLKEKLNEQGGNWERAAFAANVKKVYCDTFGVDLDFVEKWKVLSEAPPGFDMTVRQGLQFIGDGFRKIRSTIWLDLAFRDQITPKILSDVRYVNEFKRVKQEGGFNILIGRTDKLNDDPNGSEAQIKPYTEWCLKECKSHSGYFVDLRQYDWSSVYGYSDLGDREYPPDNMEVFDAFVRNDQDKDALYKIIDEKLVPLIQQYVFKSPKEEICLTSN